MQKFLPHFVLILVLILFPVASASAESGPMIISAVQTTGGQGHSGDDYIELFNPNSTPFNLNGYRLVKRTATGQTDSLIKSWTVDTLVAPHSFYLWASSGFTGILVNPDVVTSATIADNNGIALRFGSMDTGAIIDSVAWGSATNGFENVSSINPGANEAIVRTDVYGNKSFVVTAHQAKNSAVVLALTVSPSLVEANTVEPSTNLETTQQSPTESVLSTSDATIGDSIRTTENTSGTVSSDTSVLGAPPTGTSGISINDSTLTESVGDISSPVAEPTTGTPPAPVDEQAVAQDINTEQVDNTLVTANLPPKIYINELLPNPSGEDGGKEMIELYNDGDSAVGLKGYILDDIGPNQSVSSNAYILPDISISGHDYCVLTIPAGKFAMNNSGGEVVSLLSPQKLVIDSVVYEGSAPENKTFSRFEDGWLWTDSSLGNLNLKPVSVQSVQDMQATQVSTQNVSALKLSLSEIYPYPKDGAVEFVEIYNQGDAGYMTGYKIKAGNRTKSLSDIYAGEDGFILLSGKDLSVSLSNSGQTVEIISPFGGILDAVVYPKAVQGESLSKFEDNWLWSQQATPGQQNILVNLKPDIALTQAPLSDSWQNNPVIKTSSIKQAQSGKNKTKKSVPKKSLAKKTKKVKKEVATQSDTTQLDIGNKSDSTNTKRNQFAWVLLAILSVGGGMYVAYHYALKEHWQF